MAARQAYSHSASVGRVTLLPNRCDSLSQKATASSHDTISTGNRRVSSPRTLSLLSSPLIGGNPQLVADLAIRRTIPTISLFPDIAREGGLLAYGPNVADNYRRAATYVDKILKGAKPADLPVEQPMLFDFVINLKTAQALGLTVPQHVLLQATEVVQ